MITKDQLLSIGFETLPHFTITESLIFDLGRRRQLSIGNAGTPNEMLYLCEIDEHNPKKITDLVCLRNYDYDGYTTLEDIQDIIKLLKSKR